MSQASLINRRIDMLLDQVRIAPAEQRQKLMVRVRRLRAERELALMAAHK